MTSRLIDPETQKLDIQWLTVILLSLLFGISTLFIVKLPPKWIPLVILALLFPFVAMVIGGLRKMLLALILLDIPLQLDIALGSFGTLDNTGTIDGYIVSLTTICLIALYVLWILDYLVNRDTVHHPLRRPNIYLTLYIAITCLSMLTGELQRLASFEIFLLVQIFFLYLYLINKTHHKNDLQFIVAILLVGLSLESLIIILMQVMGQGFNFAGIMGNIYGQSPTPGDFSRIGGTLVSANTAGSYLSMLLAPAFSIMVTGQKRTFKGLAMIAFVLGVFALVLTGSRGAWLATLISFIIFSIVALRMGWLQIRLVLIGVVIGLLISIIFYGLLYERIFGYDAGSATSRIEQYHVAFQIIKDHPIFGVGANGYFIALAQFLTRNPNQEVFRWVVHNKYLLVWAEIGILGLLFFLMFLVSTVRQGFKIVQFNDTFISPLALAFTAAIVGQMVHMFVDVFHGRIQVQLLWTVAALLMAMSYLHKTKQIPER